MRFNKFWLPAAVLNVALLSGASVAPVFAGQSDPQSSIYGTWTLYYDWSCSGSPSSTSITFKNNGTFSGSAGSGNWSFAGDSIVFKFSSGTTYTGIEYSKTMKGRSTTYNSSYGCWTATKISNTTSTTQQVPQPLKPDGTAP